MKQSDKKRTKKAILPCAGLVTALLLSLIGGGAVVSAQDVDFTELRLRRLWITEYSLDFNLSNDFLVFRNMGRRRDGHFVNAYGLVRDRFAPDRIRRRGQHHGKPYEQYFPDISGTQMSYLAFRIDIGGWDLYVYDYAARGRYRKERRLTHTPGVMELVPAISGNRVVWVDNRDGAYRLYLYDLITDQEHLVTTLPSKPLALDFDGDRIVWTDARNDAWGDNKDTDVFLFDLALNREERISNGPPLTTAHSPSLSGDLLVWADGRNHRQGAVGATNIFLKNLATGQQWQLTDGPHETMCGISDDYVIYRDASPNRTYEWFLLDLVTSQRTGLLPKSVRPTVMKISGRQLAYVLADLSGANGAIYTGSLPVE